MNWTQAKNVVWEELDNGALLIDSASGKSWSLNATAAALWKLCDGRANVTSMARALRRSRAEVVDFCERFTQLGLLAPSGVRRDKGITLPTACFLEAPIVKQLGLGSGPRRRPTPRGVSGPG